MRLRELVSARSPRPSYLARFDSSTTMTRALQAYLHGNDFPSLGVLPAGLDRLAPLGNQLPADVRKRLYEFAAHVEAIDPEDIDEVNLEAIREWVVDGYPQREYPTVLVGSTNGAAIFLAALLGVPWLPQTFLVPVRQRMDPDDARTNLRWGKDVAGGMLEANPDLKLHHVHDPNQDRGLAGQMGYFRIKALRLGDAYERFLQRVLAEDGRILMIECEQAWPATTLGPRHVFQFGGVGGLHPAEYHHGSRRVQAFLEDHQARRKGWDPPEPTGLQPEAEWGLEPTLRRDVERFAAVEGYSMQRVRFDEPRDLSPIVADLYRRAYAEAGVKSKRLVAQTFAQIEPWWTLHTASVPYWLPFATTREARALDEYLAEREPYDEVYVSLFSHGTDSVGLAGHDHWRPILDRARKHGEYLGTDPDEHPADLASYKRYHDAFERRFPERYDVVDHLALDRAESFLDGVDPKTEEIHVPRA